MAELPEADFIAFTKAHVPSAFSHLAFTKLAKKILKLPAAYTEQKERVLCVRVIAQNHRDLYTEKFIQSIVNDGFAARLEAVAEVGAWKTYPAYHSEVTDICQKISDKDFLARIGQYVAEEPLVEPATRQAIQRVYAHLKNALRSSLDDIAAYILQQQRGVAKAQLEFKLQASEADKEKKSRDLLIQDMNSASENVVTSFVPCHVPLRLG